jgi:hypothetical protein
MLSSQPHAAAPGQSFMKKSLLLSCLCTLLLWGGCFAGDCGSCWYPYVQADAEIARFREGADGIFFAPLLMSDSSLFFGEGVINGYNRSLGFGVGGGYRTLITDQLAVGIGGMFDYHRSFVHRRHSFYQGTVCGELFFRCWELRGNGYFPKRAHQRETFVSAVSTIVNTNVFTTFTTNNFEQVAYRGGDVEVGYNLEFRCSRIRGWAGYYNYSTHFAPTLQGPRLAIQGEYDNIFCCCGSRAIIGGMWEYDRHRHHRTAIVLGLRFPIGWGCCKPTCCCCPSIRRRMNDPFRRRPGVYVRRMEQVTVVPNVFELSILFFDNNGTGPGTQTDPTNQTAVQLISMPNDVLFALQNNGNIDMSTAPGGTLTLKPGQQLLGFDSHSSVLVTLPSGNTVLVTDLTGAGRAILIVPGGATNAITLSNNNFVDGLGIGDGTPASGGLNGIFGSGVFGDTIGEMVIQDTVMSGINLVSPVNVAINSSTLMNLGTDGVTATNSIGLSANGVTISNVGNDGFNLTNAGDTTLSNLTISNTASAGIAMAGTNLVASISMAKISNTGREGIVIDNGADISLSSIQVASTGLDAIFLNTVAVASLMNISITLPHANGIHLTNANTVSGNNITIQDATMAGILLDGGLAENIAFNNFSILSIGTCILATATNNVNQSYSNFTLNPATTGVQILGSTASNISFSMGTINDGTGDGILIDPTTSATNISFSGLTLNSPQGNGIHVTGATDSNVSFSNCTVNTAFLTGILCDATTNSNFSFSNTVVTTSAAGQSNIVVENVTGLSMTGGALVNSATGGQILLVTGAGNYTFTNLSAEKTTAPSATNAIDIESTNPVGPMVLNGLSMPNTVGAAPTNFSALRFVSSGNAGASVAGLSNVLENASITNPGAIGITCGSVDTLSNSWTVSGNSVTGTAPTFTEDGIDFGRTFTSTTINPTTTLLMANNTVSNAVGNSMEVQPNGTSSTGTLTALVMNNSSTNAGINGYDCLVATTATGSFDFNVTLEGNTDNSNTPGGSAGIAAGGATTYNGTVCATITGNTLTGLGTAIHVVKPPGSGDTVNATNAGALGTVNNVDGKGVIVDPGVNNIATPCPTP